MSPVGTEHRQDERMKKGEERRLRSVGQCITQGERAFSSEFGNEPVR